MLGMDVDGRLVRHGVDEGLEVAMGRDLGVLLAKAARGGVSWVGKGRGARGIGILVQAREGVARHVDFAADLDGAAEASVSEALQAGRREGARDIADREDVGGDVLPRRAVAARGGADELRVPIGERHAEPVDLELAGVGDRALRRGSERLVRTGEPFVKLGEVHRVVHRVHARGVRDRLELLGHVAAHALGVRLGRHELGMVLLQGEKLLEGAIELCVGHLGSVKRVVGVRGMAEDAIELCVPRTRSRRGRRGHHAPEERPLPSLPVLLVCHLSPSTSGPAINSSAGSDLRGAQNRRAGRSARNKAPPTPDGVGGAPCPACAR